MIELITTFGIIIGAAASIGIFLDQYTSPATKDRLWQNLSQADRQRWSAAAVNIVVIAYESLFSGRINSFKFFKRSMITYLVFIAGTFLFLYYFFPSTFYSAASPYLMGSPSDAGIAALLTLLGGLVFWAANAQTLYFMRLAQIDPRPTPVILIFYADALLTATICIFGVALLLWTHSLIHMGRGTADVTIELRVRPAQEVLTERLARARRSAPDAQVAIIEEEILAQSDRVAAASGLFVVNVPAPATVQLARRDLRLVEEYYPGIGRPIRKIDGDTLQFIGSRGEVVSFYSLAHTLGSDVRYRIESVASMSEICAQLASPVRPNSGRYVMVESAEYAGGWDAAACEQGRPGRLNATVHLNSDNINLGELFTRHMQLVFQGIISSISTGFRTYTTVHPLAFFHPRYNESVWRHIYMISESDQAGWNEIDQELLNAYLVSEGAKSMVLNKGLPAGSIMSAIMATSVFTILLLIGAIVAIGIASVAGILTRLNSLFLIERHPFTFVMLSAGLLLALLRPVLA